MSRARRVIAVVLFVLFGALVALSIFLSAGPGERFIKGIVESRLGGALDREVRIGTLETNLFSRLVLEHVSMFRVERGDTVPLVEIAGFRVDYNLLKLLRKKIHVTSLDMDRLAVSVRRDSMGVLDLPAFGQSRGTRSGSGGGISVTLDRAVIRNARIRYHDERGGIRGDLDGVGVEVHRTGEDSYGFRVRTAGGAVSYGTVHVPITALRFEGTAGARDAGLDSLEVRIPGLVCRGNGSLVRAPGAPRVAGNIRITGDLGRLAGLAGRFVPGAMAPVAGALELSIDVAGAIARPRVGVRGGFEGVRLAGVDIKGGSFVAAADPDSISLGELTLSLLGGTVACSGWMAADGTADYRVRAALEGIELERILRRAHGAEPSYRGRVHGELTARGSMHELHLSNMHAGIQVRNVEYRERSVTDISLALELRHGEYGIRFDHESGVIGAAGRMEEERLNGRFTVSIHDLEPLAELFGVPDLDGRLRVDGSLGGSYRAPEVRADFSGRAIAYRHFPVDTLAGGVLLRNNTLHITDCTLSGAAAPVDTARPPFGVAGLSGRFSYACRVRGTVPELEGDLRADLEEFGFGGARVERGGLHAVYANGRASLEALDLRADSVLVRATGVYDVSAGNGSVEIDLLGHGTGDSTGAEIQPDVDVSVSRLKDHPEYGQLSIDFAALPDSQYTVRLDGRGIDIAPLRSFYRAIPDVGALIDLDLDGGGSFSDPRLSLRFSMRRPHFSRFAVDSLSGEVSLAGRAIAVRGLDIHDGGHRTRVTAELRLARNERGGFTISRESPFSGRISGSDFDLGLLDPVLAPVMAVRGSGSFDIAWDGTVAAPRPLGSLVVRGGSIQMHAKAPEIRELECTAALEDSTITVHSLAGLLDETPFLARGRFVIAGAGGTAHDGRRHIEAQVELDLGGSRVLEGEGFMAADSVSFAARIDGVNLSLVQPFVSGLERLAGIVDGELKLYGTPHMPNVDGRISIRGLSLYHAGLGQPVTNGTAVIMFDRRTLMIDTLAVSVGGGLITAGGSLTHRGSNIDRVDLRLAADRLHVNVPKKIELRLQSARLTYRTVDANHILNGDIVLGETRFIANFKPQSVLPFTRSIEKPDREPPPFLARTRLNVRLREGDDIWIDNNLARLRVHPELNVSGNPARPNMSGRLTVVKGYVLFLDRKFSIERGVVDFIDPDRLNPLIDIEARATVKSYRAMEMKMYRIILTVRGPLDEAVTTLVSDPPLERPDIVTLLALGVTRTELTGTAETGEDTSLRGVLLERAQALTSQRVSSYVARNVGGLLGLDQISIEGNLFRFDDSWGPELLAAKRFSDRVEITYRTNIGHLNEHNIQLDYRLTGRFSLIGETDQLGRSGIDLKYGLKFK